MSNHDGNRPPPGQGAQGSTMPGHGGHASPMGSPGQPENPNAPIQQRSPWAAQQPHAQQPHAQQPHAQQPHAQQPHAQQPHAQHAQQPHAANPYAVPANVGANPNAGANPYAAPGHNAPNAAANPYAAPGHNAPNAAANPYAAPGHNAPGNAAAANPYAAPGHNAPGNAAAASPYAAPAHHAPGNAASAQPGAANPYAAPGHNAHAVHDGFSPHAPPPGAPPPAGAATVEGNIFKLAVSRALRLRIEPNEVAPSERRALESASPPITVPYLQAFLAWRRSVLFLVGIALIPLTILRFRDAAAAGLPEQLSFILYVPAFAELALCAVCLYQLRNWTHWRQQRGVLMKTWMVYMLAPFLVFLVPVDALLQDIPGANEGAMKAVKLALGVYAMLTLAPKVVSLIAGSVRAGLVTKMLFPGSAGPGWLVVLAAPLYTLFVFILLILPYQFTGSGWYLGAMIALAVAQFVLGRAGYAMAKPMSHEDAVGRVAKARGTYVIAMIAFAVCLLAVLAPYASQIGVSSIVSTGLMFETNVLLLTLIGSDLVITNLARAHGLTSGTKTLADDANRQLTAFVGQQ